MSPEIEKTFIEYRLLAQDRGRRCRSCARPTPKARSSRRRPRSRSRKSAIWPRILRTALPEFRKTNAEVQGFTKELRDALPEVRKTNNEIQLLAREVRESVPELRKTNAEIQGLAKDVRAEIPGVRRNLDDIGDAAARCARRPSASTCSFSRTRRPSRAVIEGTDDAVRRLNDVLSDENRKNLAGTLKNVRAGTDRLDSIAASADDVLNQSRTTVPS